MDNDTKIIGHRSHFCQIPNIIDDAGLSPYAFRLYSHYKRVTGEGGECWQGTKTLAAACKMSTASVIRARRELEERGLIKITRTDNKHGGRDYITVVIVDVWGWTAITTGKPAPAPIEEPESAADDEAMFLRKLAMFCENNPMFYEKLAMFPQNLKNTPTKEDPIKNTKKEEEAASRPASAPASPKIPPIHNDFQACARIYTAVTGHFTVPAGARETVNTALLAMLDSGQNEAQIIAFLRPYWAAWNTRKTADGRLYNPTNTGWLTEWAATKTIPGEAKPKSKPGAAVYQCPYCHQTNCVCKDEQPEPELAPVTEQESEAFRVWIKTLDQLRIQDPIAASRWFESLEPLRMDGEKLILGAENPALINDRFGALLTKQAMRPVEAVAYD